MALDCLVSAAAARNLLVVALVREWRTHSTDSSLLIEYFILRIEFRWKHFDLSRVVKHLLLRIVKCLLSRLLRVPQLVEVGLLPLVLHAVHEFLKGTRDRLNTRFLILWHFYVWCVIIRVFLAGLDNFLLLIVVAIGRVFAHERVLVRRTDRTCQTRLVILRLFFTVDLNFWRLTIRIGEVLNIFNFAVSVTWHFWVGARAHARLKNISRLFAPFRHFLRGIRVNLVDNRWQYYLYKLGIAYTRKILLFAARVMPYWLLHAARIGCHV